MLTQAAVDADRHARCVVLRVEAVSINDAAGIGNFKAEDKREQAVGGCSTDATARIRWRYAEVDVILWNADHLIEEASGYLE